MIVALIVALLAPAADVLTVASNGSGDFTTIQAAIDTAAPGDVIEIQPGHYAGFSLAKDLALVGPGEGAPPIVSGLSTLTAADFALSGLHLSRVLVTGAGVLADCSIGGALDTDTVALQIAVSPGLLVSHCVVQGEDEVGGVACTVAASLVSFTGCTLVGGKGYDVFGDQGGDAGDALQVTGASHVSIAECFVRGGQAGFGSIFLNPDNGKPGEGLYSIQSTVTVRGGTSIAELLSGFTDDPHGPVTHGLHVKGGKVSVSNTWFDANELLLESGGKLLQPTQPEPLLDLDGGSSIHEFVHLRVFGPAGEPALLFSSAESGLLSHPKLEAPLWLGLGGPLLPVVTAGQQAPIDAEARLPDVPGLEGTTWRVQGVFPGLSSVMTPNKMLVTNPAAIVVRF